MTLSPAVESLAVLYTQDPALRGRLLPLGSSLSIGRRSASPSSQHADDGHLVIDDKLLSASHARLEPLSHASYRLQDLNSKNGSFVDGGRVTETLVRVGSIIRLGVTIFEVSALRRWQEPVSYHPAGAAAESLAGNSWALLQLMARLDKAAMDDRPVLLVGELGTGRAAAARRIHLQGGRSGNLVQFTESLSIDVLAKHIRSADSLFVPEIDRLSSKSQQALADLKLDGVRLMASATAELDVLQAKRALHPKLAERFAGHSVELPSLRERRGDIFHLAEAYLERFQPGRKYTWSASFLEKLLLYDWPLNCRELRVVMRDIARKEGSTLRSVQLPVEVRRHAGHSTEVRMQASATAIQTVPARHELMAMFETFAGRLGPVAEHYGRSEQVVRQWLERHDIRLTEVDS